MPLIAKLDAFKAEFEAGLPPFNASREAVALMRLGISDLVKNGAASNAVQAGQRAPDFTLEDTEETLVCLDQLLDEGPVVLTFHRGIWCPYSNLELRAFSNIAGRIARLGGRLVAISPQAREYSARSIKQLGLPFPILLDPENRVAHAYGLRCAIPDYLVDLYKGFGRDLPVFNRDPSWSLPIPARYVVGRGRIVQFAQIDPDHTRRPEVEDVLAPLSTASSWSDYLPV